MEDTKKIIFAAACACEMDLFTLYDDSQKSTMRELSCSLISLGQTFAASAQIDVIDLLPCGNTVSLAVMSISKEMNEMFKVKLHSFLSQCGGVSCAVVEL